ncbi:MAG: MoxR family ATPase, partial [Myxococcota bacterium]
MTASSFRIFVRAEDNKAPSPDDKARHARRQRLVEREIPMSLSNHQTAAPYYQASDELEAAINTALAVGAPLLLTGEPGTGKTQVAFHLAWYFGLDIETEVFRLDVRSTTSFKDLLYDFDAVRYFHAANDPRRQQESLERADFVTQGPLWRAFEHDGPSIVLLDEIDKAPRDFPNDLLHVLDQNEFY